MGLRAAVAGASGYAGGELLRLLLAHPSIELGAMAAGASAGALVTELHPQLPALAGRSFTVADPDEMADSDVVFLALPHGESAAIAAQLPDDVLVVDLGADHRLTDAAAWARFYGGKPYAGAWTYGLPELPGTRERLAGATRVAVPGCYPTSVALALCPLLAAGLVEPADIVVVAASGTSGAGRSVSAALLGSQVMGDVSAYKAGGVHQHTPEMAQSLSVAAGTPVSLSFTPLLAPMPRGILATCTARLVGGADAAALRDALEEQYADEPFVQVLAAGTWPHTAATAGSNAAHLQAAADVDAGRAVLVAAIDNLGKGAAGQAVQCANLALGLPETAGLTSSGVAP
ncbi:MAG: N-acetyl-gamma-glutamyl-phosphate reductase [Actinomycetota bacterium]|nr:N-acetyl-gamma-glutamyl-phosphate reductase [Actinomycetota bacterium]